MNAHVRISPPSGIPSETVAEIRCSHVAGKRAARALSFSSTEPCPPRAMVEAVRPRSNSDFCELGRAITVRIRRDVRVSRGIFCADPSS